MIKIVCKGYKYILKQLDDFSGIVSLAVISLKSVEGRKEYEKIFERPPKEKVREIRTRILSIFQTNLTDFSGKIIRIVRKCQNLVCGNLQIIFKEPDKYPKKKNQKNRAISIFQTRFTDFIDVATSILKRKIKLPYRTRPNQAKAKSTLDKLSDSQKVAFQKYKTFNGYLSNIFTLNPSIDNYFIDFQLKSGYKPQLDMDFLNFNNIFKLEVARCKLGHAQFKSWIGEFNQNESLRAELGIQSRHKLTERSYTRNLKIVGEGLNEYSERLKQECRELNLIGDKIWIWDRRFGNVLI